MRYKSLMVIALMVLLFGRQTTFATTAPIIDDSEKDKGIVHITYTSKEDTTFRILISMGDQRLTYPYTPNGQTETFPLQLGNGTYNVGLLKNLGNNRFAYVSQKNVTIQLEDQNIVFLNSVQNVNWSTDQKAIVFGDSLLKNIQAKDKKMNTVYDFLVDKMTYDYDKIPYLTTAYVPSIDDTYRDLMGICYDYSALMAGIQRSHGIPTKLVKGYTKFVDGYHAWNEVFINGNWYIVDTTVDNTLKGSRVKVTMVKDAKDYQKVNEY